MSGLSSARGACAALVLFFLAAAPAQADNVTAAEDAYDGHWRFSLTPYVWLAGIDGTLRFALPGSGSASYGTSAGDILSMLKFAIMGTGDVRKGDWSLFGDLIYSDLGNSGGAVRLVSGPGGLVEIPVNVSSKESTQNLILELAPAYSLYHDDEGSSADIFAGARYMGVKAKVDFNFAGPLTLLPQSGQLKQHTNIWDFVGGVKGHYAFKDSHWFINYYGDVGTGESDLTWQLAAGPGYRFNWGDVFIAYRYLHYSSGNGSRLIKTYNMFGPMLGLTIHI